MHIAVVYSLPTRRSLATPYAATDEDTKISAEAVAAALSVKDAEVTLLPIAEDSITDIKKIRADCIFNLIEWDGLDMALALRAFGLLESLGIPFTGISKGALEGIADKIRMKEQLMAAGLPTPAWQLFKTGKEKIDPATNFPVIVKPLYEHCSVGLTHEAVVDTPADLLRVVAKQITHYGQPVFAEQFIVGAEFQVTVLEQQGRLTVLPPAEILFTTSGTRAFLTYGGRWMPGHPDWMNSLVVLSAAAPGLKTTLADVSTRAFQTLSYRDYSRLDIRVNSGNPKDSRNWQDRVYILEANANPGVEDSTGYGMSVSFHAAGMNFIDFLWEIVASALRRKNRRG